MIQVRLETRRFSHRRLSDERNGKGKILAECPFCRAQVTLHLWSLAGSGKMCACGAKFTSIDRCEAMVEQGAGSERKDPVVRDRSIAAVAEAIAGRVTPTGEARLRVEKTDRSRPGKPQHEVFAPAGWSFDTPGNPHGLIRGTRDEAIAAGMSTELVRCAPGCRCGFAEGEDCS